MASIATISAAVDRITYRSGETNQHTFVVKNTTGRGLTLGARVMPGASMQADWFSLEGEAERKLSPEEVDQFVVRMQPPTDTPAGTYTLQLLVYDTAAPGENYTMGPTVAVDIQKQEPKQSDVPAKKFPWWIPITILSVLVIAALGIALWPDKVKVPDLTGLTLSQAEQNIKKASLSLGSTIDKATGQSASQGRVVEQSPLEDTAVAKGTSVDLVLEVSPARLPDVKGMSEAEAKRLLEKQGLRVKVKSQRTSEVIAGHVIAQQPPAGTAFQVGTEVNLVVAEAVPLRIPKVVGQSEAVAKRLLTEVGMRIGKVTRRLTQGQAPGTVIAQSPEAGLPYQTGDQVHLTLAQALPRLPNVEGKVETEAKRLLGSLGLKVSVTYQPTNKVTAGQVIAQQPTVGTGYRSGDKVTLEVAKPLPTIPNVKVKVEADAKRLLGKLGLKVTITYQQTNKVAAGQVIVQQPAAGTSYRSGDKVTLEVAKPLPLPTLPNVKGKTEAVARQTLEKRGLQVVIKYNRNTKDTRGLVSKQVPAAGSTYQTGAKVTLTVDKALPEIEPPPDFKLPTIPDQPKYHPK